jgi:hypothetical protein
MFNSMFSRYVFRLCLIASLATFALYMLLVVRPFLVRGLDLPSMQAIQAGMLDRWNDAPYLHPSNTFTGFMERDTLGQLAKALLAEFTLLTGPFWVILFGVGLVITLWKRWTRLQHRGRVFSGIALMANLSLILFVVSPLGSLVMQWWGFW